MPTSARIVTVITSLTAFPSASKQSFRSFSTLLHVGRAISPLSAPDNHASKRTDSWAPSQILIVIPWKTQSIPPRLISSISLRIHCALMANPTATSPHIAQQAAPVCVASTKGETPAPFGFVDPKNKTITKTSTNDENAVLLLQPAPNGGLQAWMQVLMGHLVLINGWGYLSSFGLFQSHYTSTLDATPSAISWIGSMQIFLVYLVGTFSGRALDAGHFHKVLAIGSLLQIVGVFTTSVSSQYWQLFLAQGVCKGLGDGLVFCPTVSLVATYFSTRRSLAMAITASGGATGGIIFPLIAQQLLPRIGFGWTVRTMAFVILFNTIVILSIARVRLPPRKTGPIVEWSAFREPPYMLFCIGMFFNLWAVYFAYFYVSTSHVCKKLRSNQLTAELVRQEHCGCLLVGSFDTPFGHERPRGPRPIGMWTDGRSTPWTRKHSYSSRLLCWCVVLLLGRCA
jgi:hypothetical protein